MPEENIGAVAAHHHAAHVGVRRRPSSMACPRSEISSPLKALRFSDALKDDVADRAAILDSDQ